MQNIKSLCLLSRGEGVGGSWCILSTISASRSFAPDGFGCAVSSSLAVSSRNGDSSSILLAVPGDPVAGGPLGTVGGAEESIMFVEEEKRLSDERMIL